MRRSPTRDCAVIASWYSSGGVLRRAAIRYSPSLSSPSTISDGERPLLGGNQSVAISTAPSKPGLRTTLTLMPSSPSWVTPALLLPHVGNPQFYDLDGNYQKVKLPGLDRINHYHQWADAACGEGKASANFDFAGRLTESLLLGCVANRFPDQELHWDEAALKVTNVADANKIVRRTYRKGFEVENL